jgi:hypothetical protein
MESTSGPSVSTLPHEVRHSEEQFSFIVGNIEGLLPSKFSEKAKMIAELSRINTLAICLSESHLNEAIKDAEIHIKGMVPFRMDRSSRRKGGVITYVMEEYASLTEVLLGESNSFVEVLVLHITSLNLVLANLYRPPGCEVSHFRPIITKLNEVLGALPNPTPEIVMVGDFNLPHVCWQQVKAVHGGTNQDRTQAELLFVFSDQWCLNQMIDTPTRGSNILDLIFTNNDELIHEITVNKTILSDHNLIDITSNIRRRKTISHRIPNQINTTATDFGDLNFFSTATDWTNIARELEAVDWRAQMEGASVDEKYSLIMNTALQIAIKHTPLRKAYRTPSIPRDRKVLMRKRCNLNRKISLTLDQNKKTRVQEKVKQLEEQLKESHRREREKEETFAVEAIKTNYKFFFKYVKNKATVKAAVGPLVVSSGQVISTPKEISEALKLQYESVFSRPLPNYRVVDLDSFFDADSDERQPILNNIDFQPCDVVAAIGELKANSAAGPDQFPATLLKHCASELSVPLHILWKASLREGTIPQRLRTAKITPIYKGGPRSLPKNYRPVALTSHIIKVFEKIFSRRLVSFLEESESMNKGQHGFRGGRSCLSQLLAHHDHILQALESGSNLDVVYLDFEKAFDKVDHGVLLHKLRDHGVVGLVGRWIGAFLRDRVQSVAVDGCVSAESRVESGVPQGSVLGPILFLVLLSDVDRGVETARVTSFADDTRVSGSVTNKKDVEALQKDLTSLYCWADDNNMRFNSAKFELIRYGTNEVLKEETRYTSYDGSLIEAVADLRDLGVTMSNDACFTAHIAKITRSARNQLGWILRIFATREEKPLLILFKAMIIPILEYCCQLWDPWKVGERQVLEGVQRTFTSRVCSVSHLDYWGRLKALGLYSLERRRERYIIIYVWKILRGLVPNLDGESIIKEKLSQRRGRLCELGHFNNRALGRVVTQRMTSLSYRGPTLFNSLPRWVRDDECCTADEFKRVLDGFLKDVPDQPKMPHYHIRALSNSIPDQLALMRADGKF